MCSANQCQPNVRPHIFLRFDFLFALTIEIATYSQKVIDVSGHVILAAFGASCIDVLTVARGASAENRK